MMKMSSSIRVKHLNPRQGITTHALRQFYTSQVRVWVKHLNPRQGITTAPRAQRSARRASGKRVKHLNPRQGITTQELVARRQRFRCYRVKHLNPRQGITTRP